MVSTLVSRLTLPVGAADPVGWHVEAPEDVNPTSYDPMLADAPACPQLFGTL
jgi:hypothetical protein